MPPCLRSFLPAHLTRHSVLALERMIAPTRGHAPPKAAFFSWLEPARSEKVSLQSLVHSGFWKLGRALSGAMPGGNAQGNAPVYNDVGDVKPFFGTLCL